MLGRFELDEYYDKEVHAGWHQGQYENFEVRWNREPADYQMPMPYNRGPVRDSRTVLILLICYRSVSCIR